MKALANPARIFYVPYNLALLNFIVQFLIFIIITIIGFSVSLAGSGGEYKMPVDPLYFLLSVVAVHFILMAYSKKEPQLMQIILSKINMLWKFVPKTLRV